MFLQVKEDWLLTKKCKESLFIEMFREVKKYYLSKYNNRIAVGEEM